MTDLGIRKGRGKGKSKCKVEGTGLKTRHYEGERDAKKAEVKKSGQSFVNGAKGWPRPQLKPGPTTALTHPHKP